MAKEIKIDDAKCTGMTITTPVQLAKDDKQKDSDFVIEAYTGQVVNRWWGKLVVDVDGIKAKKKMPIFQNHNSMAIVGFSTDNWKDKSFFVSGKFSEATENAKQVKALATEGFPWQASIGVSALKILEIEEGGSHKVNGKNVKGPAEVWLESEVFETSFVPLGADDNTAVNVFEKFIEADPPENTNNLQEVKKMELTLELVKKDHPNIAQELINEGIEQGKTLGRTEGAKAETERIKDVLENAMPGHDLLLLDCMLDGKTTGPQAAVRILQAEKAIRTNAATNLQADAIPPVNHVQTPEVEAPASSDVDDDAPVEEKAKAEWDGDAKLRKEFSNDYDAYLAYARAADAGHVRVLRNHKDK